MLFDAMIRSTWNTLSLLVLLACGCGSTDITGTVNGDAFSDTARDTGPDLPVESHHWIMRVGDGAHGADDVAVMGDGSILVTGHQFGAFGRAACWMGRVSAEGELTDQWTVSNLECRPYFRSAPTSDGGAVVVATAWGEGDQDAWVARLDRDLTIRWQQFLDAGGDQRYPGILALSEDRIVVVVVNDGTGDTDDLLVTMLDGDGAVTVSRSIGTTRREEFAGQAMGEGPGGRVYIAAGVEDPATGYIDVQLLALGPPGDLLWQVVIGGPGHDGAADLVVDEDGILIVGQTDTASLSSCASWVVRVDHGGNVLWQSAFNGGGCDAATWIVRDGAGAITLGGNHHVEGEEEFDYKMWLSTMGDEGAPGANLLMGDESLQYATSATVLGPDVLITGRHELFTSEVHMEMMVVRAGLDGSFHGACELASPAGTFDEGLVDAPVTVVDISNVAQEVRPVVTERRLLEADLPWAVDCAH